MAQTELLRLITAGSVDDGKSTLLGRLVYDSGGVYDDQLTTAQRNLALLTDGLRAEREQGITIDVAYRYFSTSRRKFILADTPGHEQYTRNMATGASTAQLAVILIDVRNGMRPQSRRHVYIASMLGIRRLVVAVNKMDLVGFDQKVFELIREEFKTFAAGLDLKSLEFIPVSALLGDNVVRSNGKMPWYTGPSLLEYLETVPVESANSSTLFRFPVQYIIRPHQDFRGYAGQVASGRIRPGDGVISLPSGRTSRVKSIPTFNGELLEAFAPVSATLALDDELDISRGDMLADPLDPPQVSQRVEADVVWLDTQALKLNRPYLVKHATQLTRATVCEVVGKMDINTLEKQSAERLELNDIGRLVLETHRPLFFDPYYCNRATGSFILIDVMSNATAGAGMIRRGL